MSQAEPDDDALAFTVASVWRDARVSCPHPDILRAWLAAGLEGEAAEFVAFHLTESQCPFCNGVVDELRAIEESAMRAGLRDLQDRLMRSTAAAVRRAAGR
jgi:hypothetical protein